MYGGGSNHYNGGETAPMLIPNNTHNGSSHNNDNDNNDDVESSLPQPQDNNDNNTAPPYLLTSPASLTTGTLRFLSSCRPQTPTNSGSDWATEAFLGCSPMVSGPRSIRLPNLDLREARRVSMIRSSSLSSPPPPLLRLFPNSADQEESNRLFALIIETRRASRKSKFGKRMERNNHNNPRSSPLILGPDLLYRRTPSGLSLMDLTPDAIEQQQQPPPPQPSAEEVYYRDNDQHVGDNEDVGYGSTMSTIPPQLYNEPLKTTEDEQYIMPTLKESQSCNIADLGIELSPHQQYIHASGMSNGDTSDKTLLQELKEEFASQQTHPLVSLLYGLVNTSIVLPVVMSFGSIIYHDDFFRPYLSVLMKLTVVSGAIHQITFSTVSSLPFAVGQVQDAGLIFLSAMARDIVVRCKALGVDDVSILATTTIGLSLFTAVLGAALIVIGKFKLASYCQLLPSSVVGGYLAYIGFFCGQAGLALMASVDVTGLSQWYKFLDPRALTLLAPGVVGGCFIYFMVRTFRHMAVLPSTIAMLMVAFYLTLWATGMSVEEATRLGWINQTVETPSWVHTWDFLQMDKVVWRVLPSQTFTIIAMISVVALSSSLDIAAIEIEMKRPLDYNHELTTVGFSNIVSGLTGGYTGSYIFSQTIFSLRMGIRSRAMGYVIAAVSLVTVVLPFNVLAFIPNFFFGSLLMMICLDLMFEWLIDVREKVTPAEYVVVIMTFCLLQVLGVEFGIVAGICLYVVIDKLGFDVGKEVTTE
eukprot:CAMPEP_0113438742 /NCGR_PEP_ID=MMETSP0013_2-20120614/38106_1 /TAXON_ID=2843 ORGANISM="Skeletonema costatum, Strain 1716" /NCGR_SAMPLE_ID=MMETSP0013_2 /ASSEMBLY_ACC=CAM_ASM_000158 /LENGTH=754 /DNA_ID=CAMNT_0000329473 /DNA_START=38 /DNA_END=2299 /DNA_ORIENTATION=+ /assembly_acc=CAM_ASM_000158